MRCLECGAEIAELAQVCGRCGAWAPAEYQLYVTPDRAGDAAGGPAPTAIYIDAGQQHPESAPDPDVDAAELAEWAGTRKISATRLRPGYDMEEVDAFLGAIRDTFLGIREPSLMPDAIRAKQFSTTRLRPGYVMEEVDAILDEAESRLAQVGARRGTPAAGPESGVADPAAEATQIRCLECGAENAGAAQACARCRAPIGRQVPVSADRAEDGPGEPIEPPPAESVHQATGQPPGPGSRRNAWIAAGLGLVLLVSLTVLAASVAMIVTRSASARPSAPPAPSSSPSLSSPAASAVAEDGLQAGDCLTGSDLGLGTTNPWPDTFTVVPCTRPHVAEVFFAADAWPLSMGSYPGDSKIDNEADARCSAAFRAYDGTDSSDSALSYDYIDPDSYSWPPGDRRLVCIAYNSTSQYPDGAPVDYSIKGSGQ
jgi:DivIVA domain-containing protein